MSTIRTAETLPLNPPRFSAGEATNWLLSPAIIHSEGAVASWHNPQHPGYAYPEAAGLWLSWFFRRAAPSRQALDLGERVAERLAEDLERGPGVGRDGQIYAFDTAVALRGLLATQRAGIPVSPGAIKQGVRVLSDHFEARSAYSGPPAQARWSTDFGPHLAKTAWAIHNYSRDVDPSLGSNLLSTLHRELRDKLDELLSNPAQLPYTHAYLYALEGLVLLDEVQGQQLNTGILDALEHLAQVQSPAGGIPAWHATEPVQGPLRSEATAQALRLWIWLAPGRFEANIHRALDWLSLQQAPCGGVRYEEGSADINTWATLFTLQAFDWHRHGPAAHEIL